MHFVSKQTNIQMIKIKQAITNTLLSAPLLKSVFHSVVCTTKKFVSPIRIFKVVTDKSIKARISRLRPASSFFCLTQSIHTRLDVLESVSV